MLFLHFLMIGTNLDVTLLKCVGGPVVMFISRHIFRVYRLGCKHSLRYDGLAERDITFILFAPQ